RRPRPSCYHSRSRLRITSPPEPPMSRSLRRWSVALPVALAACLPALVTAQTTGDTKKSPNGPYSTQEPPTYHTTGAGRGGTDASGYAPGYDPRTSGAFLSTAPSVRPVTSVPAFSSAAPFAANTFPPYSPPYGVWQPPTGAALQGMASLTAATGQY